MLSASLKQDLERQGFAVDLAKQGIEAEYMGDEMEYDLVVLDLGLPQRSGIDVLKNWRSKGNGVPVLILTARDAWHERVAGFKAGADDYLGKPFHVEELVVRLQALARRSNEMVGSSLKAGGVELDEEKQQLILP
ncbi:MAG: response regulator, partial [Candidatus Thiodiazotropha taylori]|nr:response regulator [Candidatus Thiodiazotropha taylori]MCW4290649.1 response regulator [Candidatus Thiodiazotropha taylori]